MNNPLPSVLIVGFDTYRDGGTSSFTLNGGGEVTIDRRIEVKDTPEFGRVWLGYPGAEGSRHLTSSETLTVLRELRRVLHALQNDADHMIGVVLGDSGGHP
jgi:hypothetical protein